MSTTISLRGISKSFGDSPGGGGSPAVSAVDLEIRPGELFFLLGPSGCGKTTLLRMIAGFTSPSAGRIFFQDKDITDVPAHLRNTGMVFQSYALWPHMTVAENVAFGLRTRRLPGAEVAARVTEVLELVRMGDFATRRPTQLSGGQQQRIALARAIAVRPSVLLLDEPLSNLDARLRSELRTEVRRVCRDTGCTAIYVTHDQEDALSMADRIAIMRQGKIVQIGSPRDLYERPQTSFVASFLGDTNLFEASCVSVEPPFARIVLCNKHFRVACLHAPEIGSRVRVCVRPESIVIGRNVVGNDTIGGTISNQTYLGSRVVMTIETDLGVVAASLPAGAHFHGQTQPAAVARSDSTEARELGLELGLGIGDQTTVSFEPHHALLLEE